MSSCKRQFRRTCLPGPKLVQFNDMMAQVGVLSTTVSGRGKKEVEEGEVNEDERGSAGFALPLEVTLIPQDENDSQEAEG